TAVSWKPQSRSRSAAVESVESCTRKRYVCPAAYVLGRSRIRTDPPGVLRLRLPPWLSMWHSVQSSSAGFERIVGAAVADGIGPCSDRTPPPRASETPATSTPADKT